MMTDYSRVHILGVWVQPLCALIGFADYARVYIFGFWLQIRQLWSGKEPGATTQRESLSNL